MMMLTVSTLRRVARLGLCLSGCVSLACSGGTASVDGGRGGDTGPAGGTGGASDTGGRTGAGGSGSQGSGGAIVTPPADGGASGGSGGTAATGGRGGSGELGRRQRFRRRGRFGRRPARAAGAGPAAPAVLVAARGSGGARGPVACPTMSTAAATTTFTLDGNNVSAGNVNGLTFKGFGVLSANGTSAVLMDYKSAAPGRLRDAASDPVRRHQPGHDPGEDRDGQRPEQLDRAGSGHHAAARPKRRTSGGIPAFSWRPTPRSSTRT